MLDFYIIHPHPWNSVTVPHWLQEIHGEIVVPDPTQALKGFPIAAFSPFSCMQPYLPPNFDWDFEKDGRCNWLELNYNCVLFMSHLACHSLSIPNYMSDTGVECLLLLNWCYYFSHNRVRGECGMFLLLPCLYDQSAWFTHLYHLLSLCVPCPVTFV